MRVRREVPSTIRTRIAVRAELHADFTPERPGPHTRFTQTHAVEVFAPTVSPYNLLLRARRIDEAVRRRGAEERHRKLVSGPRAS